MEKDSFEKLATEIREGLLNSGEDAIALGYVGFDFVKCILGVETNHENKLPASVFCIYENKAECNEFQHYISRIQEKSNEDGQWARIRSKTSKEEFEEKVVRIKKKLVEGETFQVVISRYLEVNTNERLISALPRISRDTVSPYTYYMNLSGVEIAGISPETLVKVSKGKVTTYPIAGTIQVSENEGEDKRLRKELLRSKKDASEHVMLVDLARNDIGKISRYGTVKVEFFMRPVRYSYVQHLVSCVSGYLADGENSFSALFSTFPAGTVSGAPKKRAVEIINELEDTSREIYSGAIGFFDSRGNADFAIAIRTIFGMHGSYRIQAGVGIVLDSVPEKEYAETQTKMSPLLKAIGVRE